MSKILCLIAIPLLAITTSSLGQVIVTMNTNTSENAGVHTITQTGSSNVAGEDVRRFVFDRLDAVEAGAYAGWNLLSVTVIIQNQVTGNFEVVVINNDPINNYTGPSGDFARTNLNLPTFSFGAGTAQDISNPNIAVGDFLTASPVVELDLFGVNLPAEVGTTSTSSTGSTVLEERDVDSSFWAGYSGAGSFNFDVRAAFGLETVISGPNIDASQSTGSSIFTATVIYTAIIPEPSTYGLILGVFAIGMLIVRRRLQA